MAFNVQSQWKASEKYRVHLRFEFLETLAVKIHISNIKKPKSWKVHHWANHYNSEPVFNGLKGILYTSVSIIKIYVQKAKIPEPDILLPFQYWTILVFLSTLYFYTLHYLNTFSNFLSVLNVILDKFLFLHDENFCVIIIEQLLFWQKMELAYYHMILSLTLFWFHNRLSFSVLVQSE